MRLTPASEPELVDAVAVAAAARQPCHVVGRGSKTGYGRPVEAGWILDLSPLAGIYDYQPDELVVRLGPGTPLAELDALLAAQNQCLAFEPPDLGPLYGEPAAAGSIGGAVACNLSGPRRPRFGAARDHLLGFTAVSGRGERFKAGGQVVKNVSGYDLPKLMAGSFGTLACFAELTLRVAGRPAGEATLVLLDLDEVTAVALLNRIAGGPLEPTGLAYLPAGVAIHGPHPLAAAATLLRFEGPPGSVAERLQQLESELAAEGTVETLEGPASAELWAALRDVAPLLPGETRQIWRLALPPAAGGRAAARLGAALPGSQCYLDWGGGLLWLALAPRADAAAPLVRALAAGLGGQATLVRAALDIRRAIAVFEPEAAPLAALSRRVKRAFDPDGLLNPGRLRPEW